MFVRSFPVAFFPLICLPQHVSMCHQSVTKKKKSIYGQPVHSAGKEMNRAVAASRAVKENLKKKCNLCSDFYKYLICQQPECLPHFP